MDNNYVGQFSISRGEKCERKMEEATYFMNDSGWELFFLLLRSYVFYERIRGWKLFFLLYKKLRILWTTPGMRTLLPIVCCWPSRRWPHSTNHSSRQRAYTYVHIRVSKISKSMEWSLKKYIYDFIVNWIFGEILGEADCLSF